MSRIQEIKDEVKAVITNHKDQLSGLIQLELSEISEATVKVSSGEGDFINIGESTDCIFEINVLTGFCEIYNREGVDLTYTKGNVYTDLSVDAMVELVEYLQEFNDNKIVPSDLENLNIVLEGLEPTSDLAKSLAKVINKVSE